jgi:hypothetical protein
MQPYNRFLVPTLRVGMQAPTLRVEWWDAERPRGHSQAEPGNEELVNDQLSKGRDD